MKPLCQHIWGNLIKKSFETFNNTDIIADYNLTGVLSRY